MSDLDVAVKARFVNQMGSGARAAERDLNRVGQSAKKLASADFGTRMRNQLRAAAEGAATLHARLKSVGDFLIQLRAGYETLKRTLSGPALADADFTDIVIDIAQKANLAKDGIGGLSDEIKAMAERLKSSPASIGKGIDVLMGAGLDLDVSRKLIDPIQKVSKAYRVETDSVSQAVFSMVNNLKIAPDQIEVALGRIAQAASDGRYEISNFAEGMPQLAATMQGLGQTGLPGASRLAAALETISGSVGDPGQATVSVDDMLQKVNSPDVRNAFKKAKIDIAGRIAKAQKDGTDVFEAIYKATMKATGGDVSKVINLFGDKEARRGVVALMQNWQQYVEMRDRYDKINSPNKLNADFDMRKEGSGNSYRTFAERWEAMQTAIGKGINTYIKPAVDGLSGLLDVVTALTEQVPRLAGAVVILGATLGALAVSASVGSMLKGLAGLGGGGAVAAGAAAGGLGVFGLLGRGIKLGGRLLGVAGAAYSGWELGSWLGKGAVELGGVAGGKYYTPADQAEYDDLKKRRDAIAKQIDNIRRQSKVPEMADILIRPLQDQLDQLEGQLRSFDELKVKPQIDPSSIDDALGKVRALHSSLQGLAAPTFMGNAAPAAAVRAHPGGGINQANNIHVAGYDPGVVARRVVREQNRAIASAQSGALHDTWSLA